MKRFLKKKNAVAVLEYLMFIIIILGVAVVSQKYVTRAIFGKWKGSVDSLSFGRQYDPQKTLQCVFDPPTGIWYDVQCAEAIYCASWDNPCMINRINQCSPPCIGS